MMGMSTIATNDFIHIPKTGRTQIKHACVFGKSSYATARDYRECNRHAFDHAVSFAAIRHSVDRLVRVTVPTCPRREEMADQVKAR